MLAEYDRISIFALDTFIIVLKRPRFGSFVYRIEKQHNERSFSRADRAL